MHKNKILKRSKVLYKKFVNITLEVTFLGSNKILIPYEIDSVSNYSLFKRDILQHGFSISFFPQNRLKKMGAWFLHGSFMILGGFDNKFEFSVLDTSFLSKSFFLFNGFFFSLQGILTLKTIIGLGKPAFYFNSCVHFFLDILMFSVFNFNNLPSILNLINHAYF